MNRIWQKIRLAGRALAVVAVLALMGSAVPAGAQDTGGGTQGAAGKPKAKLHTLGETAPLSRGVVRTAGQPRAVPVTDEFDSIPLGGPLGGQLAGVSPSARSRSLMPSGEPPSAQVTHDCALAEQGEAAAAYRIGRRFLFGVGLPRDKRMGVAWMRAAASRGFGPAMQVAALVPRNIGRMRPWCRPEVAPLHRISVPPAEIVKLVTDLAPAYSLDPRLVLAVIEIESAFHTDALSPKDAAGLMQLIPDTAERFGVHNVFDPTDNLRGGMKYLRWLLAYFEGNVTLALAGYNAGERAVDRYGGVPPYAETQSYVRLIHGLYPPTQHRFEPGVTEPSARFARQTAEAAH
jgi:hypothetical protein